MGVLDEFRVSGRMRLAVSLVHFNLTLFSSAPRMSSDQSADILGQLQELPADASLVLRLFAAEVVTGPHAPSFKNKAGQAFLSGDPSEVGRQFAAWAAKKDSFTPQELANATVLKASTYGQRICTLAPDGGLVERLPFDGEEWSGTWRVVPPHGLLQIDIGDGEWVLDLIKSKDGLHGGFEGDIRFVAGTARQPKQSAKRWLKVTSSDNTRVAHLLSRGRVEEHDPFKPGASWPGRYRRERQGLEMTMEAEGYVYSASLRPSGNLMHGEEVGRPGRGEGPVWTNQIVMLPVG